MTKISISRCCTVPYPFFGREINKERNPLIRSRFKRAETRRWHITQCDAKRKHYLPPTIGLIPHLNLFLNETQTWVIFWIQTGVFHFQMWKILGNLRRQGRHYVFRAVASAFFHLGRQFLMNRGDLVFSNLDGDEINLASQQIDMLEDEGCEKLWDNDN